MPNFAYTTYIFRTGNNLPKAYNSLKDFHNKILSSSERWKYGVDKFGEPHCQYYLTCEAMIEEEYYKESNGLFYYDCTYGDFGIQKPKRGFITSVSDIQLVQDSNSSIYFQFELKADDAWITNASFIKQLLMDNYGDDITFTYYANEEGAGTCYTTDPEYATMYNLLLLNNPITDSREVATEEECLKILKEEFPGTTSNSLPEAYAEVLQKYGDREVYIRKYELVSDDYTKPYDQYY